MISLMNHKRRRTPIGVDIGENGVRAVQITRNDGQYSVSSTALAE